MKVWAGRQAGRADETDDRSGVHALARGDLKGRRVGSSLGLQPFPADGAVIDHDAVAVGLGHRREHDLSLPCGGYRGPLGRREVDARVQLGHTGERVLACAEG